jgi:serine/threonine protein kinase
VSEWPREYGPYLLLKNLGTGGTGDVFLARPQDEGAGVPSPVVIKRLHGALHAQGDFVKRFQHEAELAVAIESPHLARVYDVGRVGESFYIAMQYLSGWPLARVIQDLKATGHRPSLDSLVDIMVGALSGLEALHGARAPRTGKALGIVHRDVAPKNIMVGEDGRTRLIDLGLGKSTLQDWKTGTGVVMGSPGYMAPEQVQGLGVDARTDTYAAGIVLWELLTLERYIKRGPVPLMLRAQVQPEYRPPSAVRGDVPAALDAVCRRALAVRPEARYPSAAAFREALLAAVPLDHEGPQVSTLVGALLWGELDRAKTEVTHLLEFGAPTPPPGAEPLGPRPGPPPPPPVSGPHDGLPPPLVHLTPTATAGTPTPLAYAAPMSSGPLPVPGRGVPPQVVVGLMAATLAVGIGVGAVLLRDTAEGPAVQVALPPRAGPAPQAAPQVAPRVTPEEPEPTPEAEAEAPARPLRRPSPRPAPEAAPPARPAPEEAPITALGLLKRARAALSALPPESPATAEGERLVSALQAEASALEPAPARLEALARRVAALESAGGGR